MVFSNFEWMSPLWNHRYGSPLRPNKPRWIAHLENTEGNGTPLPHPLATGWLWDAAEQFPSLRVENINRLLRRSHAKLLPSGEKDTLVTVSIGISLTKALERRSQILSLRSSPLEMAYVLVGLISSSRTNQRLQSRKPVSRSYFRKCEPVP